MTCPDCRVKMASSRENVKYDASGLRHVTLIGVEVRRCATCGEFEVVIPHIEELHQLIAHALISKPAPLDHFEIKYLRKHLGWSGADFSRHFGVTPETVSRWESAKVPMGSAADRLLRAAVALGARITDYHVDSLAHIKASSAKPLKVGLRLQGAKWAAVAA